MRLLYTTVILAPLAQPVWALWVLYCVGAQSIAITKKGAESLPQYRERVFMPLFSLLFIMAGVEGLEPPTPGFGERFDNLS